jgi:precorrin-8X/cobalt-precorrin-8 methylmutase
LGVAAGGPSPLSFLLQEVIMSVVGERLGVLIISHGSPRAEANQGFERLVARVASRLVPADVLPAFFSIVRPDIPDQVAEMVSRGVRRILLLPYFLYSGQHVTVDIPALLDQCRSRFPDVVLEVLPNLENDPVLEDLLVERLAPLADVDQVCPQDGAAIEQQSYRIIERQLADWGTGEPGADQIIRRVIHATADLSFARTMRVHPEAIARGIAALAYGKPIICDVNMLKAGMTKIQNDILCAIDSPEVSALAEVDQCTRAAAAMTHLAPRLEGAIVAIGNAPTALWRVLELSRNGGPRPAVVVGLPVGFVGARQSKLALLDSDLCYITNTSHRGGSPAAAASVNVLALLAKESR